MADTYVVEWHEGGFEMDSMGRRVFDDEAEAALFVSRELPTRPNYVGDAEVKVRKEKAEKGETK